MGQAESQPAALAHAVKTGVAFHVLRVAERSPAASAGIDPFFDFVCGINGKPLGEDIDTLTDALEHNEGRKIYLQIYSTKRKELRDVSLIPSRTWSSSESSPQDVNVQPSLIGLSLRLCNPQHALEQVWHVLEILEDSPAQSAGLVPFGDWIVGYAGGVLRGEGDFYDVVENHVDKPLRLFVYNADYDVTREAILVPNRNWGGEGLLGCGVGYGLLHRIPKPQDRTRLPPEADDEDDDEGEQELEHRVESARHAAPAPAPAPAPTTGPASFRPQPPPPPRAKASIGGSSSGHEEDLRQTSSGRYAAAPPPPPSASASRSAVTSPPPRRVANVTSPTRSAPIYAPPPPRASASTAQSAPKPPQQPQVQQAAPPPPRQRHESYGDDDGYGQGAAVYNMSYEEDGDEDDEEGAYLASAGVEVVPTASDDAYEDDYEGERGYEYGGQQKGFGGSTNGASTYGGYGHGRDESGYAGRPSGVV